MNLEFERILRVENQNIKDYNSLWKAQLTSIRAPNESPTS